MTAYTERERLKLTVVGRLPRRFEFDAAALQAHGFEVERVAGPRGTPGEIVLVGRRSLAARAGSGVWLALAPSARAPSRRWRQLIADAELVLVGSEGQRQRVEGTVPETIGRVWVVPDMSGKGAETLRRLAGRYRPRRRRVDRVSPIRVGVIGYNLKFITRIVEHLERLPGVSLRVREWSRYAVDDDPDQTTDVISWADTIVCEWCGPNAVLASHAKKAGQRLVVRLHRFELERDDWREVDIDAVDAVVTVGFYYRRKVLEVTGWPAAKVIETPNWVDIDQLDRPKLPGAEHTLGLLGAIPARKRLDRALGLIETLRGEDPRFVLRVKTEHPWEHRWIREDESEHGYFERQLPRLEALVEDGGAVLDPAGPDVASWFRGVGQILSTSDDESFHLSPAEGMASGAVPVVWSWPGADEVYHPRWVADSLEEMVDRCREAADPLRRSQLVDLAREEVAARYALETVLGRWERVTGLENGQPT